MLRLQWRLVTIATSLILPVAAVNHSMVETLGSSCWITGHSICFSPRCGRSMLPSKVFLPERFRSKLNTDRSCTVAAVAADSWGRLVLMCWLGHRGGVMKEAQLRKSGKVLLDIFVFTCHS